VSFEIKLPTMVEMLSAADLLKKKNIASPVITVDHKSQFGHGLLHLKLESELPYGSYKIRGVTVAVETYMNTTGAPPKSLMTISAGNMAQAVAALGKDLNIPVTACVPSSAPQSKTEKILSLGANLICKPMDEIWSMVLRPPPTEPEDLLFHPLLTPGILAGYSTIIDEISACHVPVDAIFVPFGVGGLTLGIASSLRFKYPDAKLIAVECEASPTLTSALRDLRPVVVTKNPTIVDAIGTPSVVPEVLEFILSQRIHHNVEVVSEREVLEAIRVLYRQHNLVVEGAAAAAFAAACRSNFKNAVVLITGKHINTAIFKSIVGDAL
jgi:threonine dehydratase